MKFRTKYKWSERSLRFSRLDARNKATQAFRKLWMDLQNKMWSDYCSFKGINPSSIGLNLSPIVQEEIAPEIAPQASRATRSEEDEAGTTIPAAIK